MLLSWPALRGDTIAATGHSSVPVTPRYSVFPFLKMSVLDAFVHIIKKVGLSLLSNLISPVLKWISTSCRVCEGTTSSPVLIPQKSTCMLLPTACSYWHCPPFLPTPLSVVSGDWESGFLLCCYQIFEYLVTKPSFGHSAIFWSCTKQQVNTSTQSTDVQSGCPLSTTEGIGVDFSDTNGAWKLQ